ncbi:MAG: CpaF family protein [Oligoflexia bacterium]|nr:CpaF family protein [Oligoflexia bacterium]
MSKNNSQTSAPPKKKNTIWQLLEELADKKGVTEITINSPNSIFAEKDGRFFLLDVRVQSNELFEFCHEVATYNNKLCDEQNPVLDGTLPDGSRINIIHPPYVKITPVITIRKYLNELVSFDKTPGIFATTPEWIEFFRATVRARLNIIISGGTGVGKTTLMNLLLQEIPKDERVITIEDTRELNFKLPNLVRMEVATRGTTTASGPTVVIPLTLRDLVRNTLRMRPDRIIVGEVRGGEIFDLLQAINTGHDGSMTSIHANSAGECLKRIATLYLLAGYDVPIKAIRGQVATALNFIIQIGRSREGQRIISEVSEITGMEGDNVLMQKIGTYSPEKKCLVSTDIVPTCSKRLIERGGLSKDLFVSGF